MRRPAISGVNIYMSVRTLISKIALTSATLILAAALPASAQQVERKHVHGEAILSAADNTEVKDQAALARLLRSSGMTLQWIGWDKRGPIKAKWDGNVVHISGRQAGPNGGLVRIEGDVVAIEKDYFIFRGTILILDAPDMNRICDRTGNYEFRITKNRKYWRLQQMEACGGLTDYVDIYF